MNTIIKVSTMVLMLLMPYSGYSASELDSAAATGSKSFRLTLKDDAKNVYIRLKDQQGYILYEEYIPGPVSYNRVFNVTSLPRGDYQLEMEYPTKYQILPVEIRSNQVVLDESRLEEIFKPIVHQNGAKVSVSLLNTKQGPLRILVYDRNSNELLSQQVLKDDLNLGKQYDFSQAKPGSYVISLNCNNRRYSHTVTVKE